MTDGSFKVWHVAVNCDNPVHRKVDDKSNDYESVEPDLKKADYLAEMRSYGWIFHRDGRVTCPDCAKSSTREGL